MSAMDIKQVDVLGFSVGGCVAQLVALNAPNLVRRLILAGTLPSMGEMGNPRWGSMLATAVTEEETKRAMIACFFSHSEKKQAVGEKWWQRMTGARKDRAPFLQGAAIGRQMAAGQRFGDLKYGDEGTYDRLDQIKIPVLVATGSDNCVARTSNSWILHQRLVNAEVSLHLFPDSGHGFLDEYVEAFSKTILDFLAN